MWFKYVPNNVWKDFRLPESAFATVARESFNGKFSAKIDLPNGHFMLAWFKFRQHMVQVRIK